MITDSYVHKWNVEEKVLLVLYKAELIFKKNEMIPCGIQYG